MIFYSLKSIKLAKKTSHDVLMEKYEESEEKMKMLLYSGSIKSLRRQQKEHKIIRQALIYQYTPQYSRYIEKLRKR